MKITSDKIMTISKIKIFKNIKHAIDLNYAVYVTTLANFIAPKVAPKDFKKISFDEVHDFMTINTQLLPLAMKFGSTGASFNPKTIMVVNEFLKTAEIPLQSAEVYTYKNGYSVLFVIVGGSSTVIIALGKIRKED